MTSAQELTQKKCRPCEGVEKPLTAEQARGYLKDLPDWKLDEKAKSIHRDYVMKNFLAAVGFIQDVARIAEAENHHPDIHLTGYRKLRVELSTHAICGLSENDFIEAAKISVLKPDLKT
jgi:4a-hydroxytetrahydrobiopterin dehydratase